MTSRENEDKTCHRNCMISHDGLMKDSAGTRSQFAKIRAK